MNIYKLKYPNRESAITDLTSKSVYVETDGELTYGKGIHAIVELGLIILQDAVYENTNLIKEPTYVDGYHYDVMSEITIDFGENEIQVNNPKHMFAGH